MSWFICKMSVALPENDDAIDRYALYHVEAPSIESAMVLVRSKDPAGSLVAYRQLSESTILPVGGSIFWEHVTEYSLSEVPSDFLKEVVLPSYSIDCTNFRWVKALGYGKSFDWLFLFSSNSRVYCLYCADYLSFPGVQIALESVFFTEFPKESFVSLSLSDDRSRQAVQEQDDQRLVESTMVWRPDDRFSIPEKYRALEGFYRTFISDSYVLAALPEEYNN